MGLIRSGTFTHITSENCAMKNFFTSVFAVFCLSFLLNAQPDIVLQPYASGFTRPLDIAHCGDGRLFIVEQRGIIWILDENGIKLPQPFLNIDPQVGYVQNEQGLLGLAFHPNYQQNGYFFVNYTDNSGDTKVSRFSVMANDPNKADPASEKVLLQADQPYWNHNGGCLKFGPDGYLYIGLGDGGSGGDPLKNGQNRLTFLGKILRIDVDNGDPYAIPADNPFANDDFTLDEIWALGMRNPWRFSFDRITGDLWIGDVGQDDWEEIDFQPASSTGGQNYGWRCYEGLHPFNTGGCAAASEMTSPVAEYQNSNQQGCSVTGGMVYRGCDFPGLYGRYLFADYCTGKIWSVIPNGNGGWTTTELANLDNNQFVSFGENDQGELFLAALGAGTIYRITSTSAYAFLQATPSTCEGSGDGAIAITIPGTGDEPLAATWSDGSTDKNRTGLASGSYTVTMTLGNGCSLTQSIEVGVAFPMVNWPVVTLDSGNVLNATPGFSTYQWLFGGNPVAGAAQASFTPQESGTYSVLVTNAGGCEAVSNEVEVTISDVISLEGIDFASVTPNPFSNTLRIELQASRPQRLTLQLVDMQGKIHHQEAMTLSGRLDKTLNFKSLPQGIFLLILKTENGEWTKKLVKQ